MAFYTAAARSAVENYFEEYEYYTVMENTANPSVFEHRLSLESAPVRFVRRFFMGKDAGNEKVEELARIGQALVFRA